MIGEIVSRYRMPKLLGARDVHLAEDLRLRRRVALELVAENDARDAG
jgi:hypothetical protein